MIQFPQSGMRLWVVTLMATAFFITGVSCNAHKNTLNQVPSNQTSLDQTPVFTYLNSVFLASPATSVLLQLDRSIKNRTFARYKSDYLLWDSLLQKIIHLNGKGKVINSFELEAAFVWVFDGVLFAREEVFAENSGFQFVLYKLTDNLLHELWRGELDCFPSDVLYGKDGIVYLAGGNRANSKNSVYRIRSGLEADQIMSVPKNSDFLRLIQTSDSLVVFASSRDKSPADMNMYVIDDEDSVESLGFTKILPSGLPDKATAFFGFGFSFKNEPVIPVASSNGDVSLVRFQRTDSGYQVVSIVENSGGCFLPVGIDTLNSYFWYLAHDSLANPENFNLARYDGTSITFQKLQ